MSKSFLRALRESFHGNICGNVLGMRSGVFNNADKDNRTSVCIAKGIAERIGSTFCREVDLPSAQASGSRFADHVAVYLRVGLDALRHIRPGDWTVDTSQRPISDYDQYSHLAEIEAVAKAHPEIRTVLGGDYLVKPDIVVTRAPLKGSDIDIPMTILGDDVRLAGLSPIRAGRSTSPILHASVSCKWTMRSDRAQNTRTEALNLLRNRKGKAPMMAVVTAEPLPSRIASIAEGTGDVDCTYHFALYEMMDALQESDELRKYSDELLRLIEGRRLRDISDLPLDLCI